MNSQLYLQVYHGARNRLGLRLTALLIAVALHLIMLPFSFGVFSGAISQYVVIAIVMVVSSIIHLYITAVNLFVSFSNINRLFDSRGYFFALTPVPSWKVLLGNIIPAMFFDTLTFIIAMGGFVAHSFGVLFSLRELREPGFTTIDTSMIIDTHAYTIGFDFWHIWFVIAPALVYYGIGLLGFAFWRAASKSIFYRFPLRAVFGAIAAVAALWVLNWFSILLASIGEVERIGPLLSITLPQTTISLILISFIAILQFAALLAATGYLMDRRINL